MRLDYQIKLKSTAPTTLLAGTLACVFELGSHHANKRH